MNKIYQLGELILLGLFVSCGILLLPFALVGLMALIPKFIYDKFNEKYILRSEL